MTPNQDNEEEFILYRDIFKLISLVWYKIILFSLLFALLVGGFLLLRDTKYVICSSFKDAPINREGDLGFMQNLVKQMGNFEMNFQGESLMTSNTLLLHVVQTLGLQASISTEDWKQRIENKIIDTLHAARGIPLNEIDSFIFKDLFYEGETIKSYLLFFTSNHTFEVRNGKRGLIKKGKLGEPISFEDITFTIEQVPKWMRISHSYALQVVPAIIPITNLKATIKVEASPTDRSILKFAMSHRDKGLAKKILNQLMTSYKEYLVNENERMSMAQIDYLEKRRGELCEKMNDHFKDHVVYLKESATKNGFMSIASELGSATSRRNLFMDKLINVDLEKKRTNGYSTVFSDHGEFRPEFGSIQREINGLKKQRDGINLALGLRGKKKKFFSPYLNQENQIEKCKNCLDNIRYRKLAAIRPEGSETTSFIPPFLFHFLPELRAYSKEKNLIQLKNAKKGSRNSTDEMNYIKEAIEERKILLASHPTQEKELVDLISDEIHILSLQENILRKRLFHTYAIPKELQGIDLPMAKTLYLHYTQELDGAYAKIKQIEFAKTQMNNDKFEYISLVGLLSSPITDEFAKNIGGLVQAMRDEQNLSEKDLGRLQKKIARQKKDLDCHLSQSLILTHLQVEQIEEKIFSTQEVMLDLLNQEIALLEKQMEDSIEMHKKNLDIEKKIIEKQILLLQEELKEIPDRWLRENQLQFAADLSSNIFEGMVRLLETKNIEHNLLQISSRPLDLAYAPLYAKPPRLILFTCIAALIGVFLAFGFYLFKGFAIGFPLSIANLKARGKRVFGKLSTPKNEMEILRTLSTTLVENHDSHAVISLLLGKGKDYSSNFAELLAREGKKILMIEADFHQQVNKGDSPGLFHYLNGDVEAPTVKKHTHYHFINMSGQTKYGVELLKSSKLKNYLSKISQSYDFIIITSQASVHSSEAKILFTFSQMMIVTLGYETLEELTPYFVWEKENRTLGFVF